MADCWRRCGASQLDGCQITAGVERLSSRTAGGQPLRSAEPFLSPRGFKVIVGGAADSIVKLITVARVSFYHF